MVSKSVEIKMCCLKEVSLVLVVLVAICSGSLILSKNGESTSDERIFGGYLARPGQFPYQASLRYNSSSYYRHICGGSIITNRFIVSAAHCFPSTNEERYRIVLGAHNISGDGVAYDVEKIFIHPGWNLSLIIHDVGLAQTNQTIEFTAHISPIAISRQFIDTSFRAVTSGWGRTNVNAKYIVMLFNS